MEKNSLENHTWVQSLARKILQMLSWRLDLNYPEERRYVMIGAPHTSNWDFVYFLLFVYASGIKMHWIGKDSLFRWPIGYLFRRLRGIAVNRKMRTDFVSQIVRILNESKDMILAIAPEGTRSKSDYWKTGFYYMALGAGTPVVMGYIDYREKMIGLGPSFHPSGDIERDFEQIKAFYSQKQGKYPDKQGTIQLRPDHTKKEDASAPVEDRVRLG